MPPPPDGFCIEHNEFFKRSPIQDYYPDQMSEHQELTVEIRLSRALPLDALRTELRNSYNMELNQQTRSQSRDNIVVISGNPSNNVTPNQILQVVQRYEPNAELSN